MQLMFAYLLIITGFYLVFSVFSPREERATLLNRYALNLEGDKLVIVDDSPFSLI